MVKALTVQGFNEQQGASDPQLWRDLADLSDLDQSAPRGYRVRATNRRETADRVDMRRCCWAPARIKAMLGLPPSDDETKSGYDAVTHRRVVASHVYRRELDIVAEATAGTLCAYGIGWFDPDDRSVLFEPIGTDPHHSGRGLTRAVCAQILSVAAELGATWSVVGPRGDAAYPVRRHVYAGLGMTQVARQVEYGRHPRG